MSWISGLCDRLCAIAGAFCGSQVPPFLNQYQHRLGGHVDELSRLVEQLEAMVRASGLSLHSYFDKLMASGDRTVAMQGEFFRGLYARWDHLSHSLDALQRGGWWERPYIFLRDFEPEIAQRTWGSFQPAVALTMEGVCFALLGVAAGMGAFYCFSFGVRLLLRCAAWSVRMVSGGVLRNTAPKNPSAPPLDGKM